MARFEGQLAVVAGAADEADAFDWIVEVTTEAASVPLSRPAARSCSASLEAGSAAMLRGDAGVIGGIVAVHSHRVPQLRAAAARRIRLQQQASTQQQTQQQRTAVYSGSGGSRGSILAQQQQRNSTAAAQQQQQQQPHARARGCSSSISLVAVCIPYCNPLYCNCIAVQQPGFMRNALNLSFQKRN